VPPPNLNGAEVEHLYGQLCPALVLFALSISGDRARAQDAVHQVFLKMIEKPNLGGVADMKAYLFTCVRNAILNDAKTRQRSLALDEESCLVRAASSRLCGGTEAEACSVLAPRRSARGRRLTRVGRAHFPANCRGSAHQLKHCRLAISILPFSLA
jgi:DNA-directed RNA polymerase specialized sigma24 family protein